MAPPLTSHHPGLAIVLYLGAVFCFTVMSALIKATSGTVPPGQAVFFRSLFAIPVILIWLTMRKELRHGLIARRPIVHIRRGVLGTTAMGLIFAGLGLLPLPEVTAIGYVAPMFTVLLAALILGERIRLIRISAVLLGLLGVLIMIWPRLGVSGDYQEAAALGALLVLLSAMARALVQIQIRSMADSESTSAIVFYFTVTATVLSLVTLPFGWVVPTGQVLVLLVLAGVVGGAAQICMTSSYRFAPVSMLAPVEYVSMLFAILIGYVWFSEVPTAVMLSGAGLIIAGNILVIWREHHLGLERARVRPFADPKS